MTKIAIYPGSFDPVTRGHEDIIKRCFSFSDRVIVAVAVNSSKTPLFTLQERLELLQSVLDGVDHVQVDQFDGLLADYARRVGAHMLVRGLRAVSDFEYEFEMALMNRDLNSDLETVFLTPAVDHTFLRSSLVREVASLGGDVSGFVHPKVEEALKRKLTV